MNARPLALMLALASTVVAAQSPQRPSPRASESYSSATTAILVDVVVRDRRGRPVTDLTKDDFEISENAVPQTIGSFSVVSRATGIGIQVKKRVPGTTTIAGPTGTEPSPAADEKEDEPPTTAIVFDTLRAEPLAIAQKAALAELPMSGESPGRVAVFTAEPGLRMLQSYTDDLALVRAAVRRVSAAGEGREESEAERRAQLADRLRQLDALSQAVGAAGAAPGGAGGGGGGSAAQAIVEAKFANMEMSLIRSFETIDRDHRGLGTAAALMTIVQSLAVRPGRKSIVYFSEGLPASPSLEARLDSVVGAANRANVSVYTIDAAGLSAESSLRETRRELDQTAEERLRAATLPDTTGGPMLRPIERSEDLLRLDRQGGLARLAEDTGGFLVRDTNDLGSAFRRIEEDNRFHYLLTYSPSNENFDGKFRTINVKVKRDGAQVFARKGYFAVRSTTAPVLSYEAPAIAALDQPKLPNAFAMGAAALVFPEPTGKTLVPVIVRVATDQLSFDVNKAKGSYSAQAAVVARIKNGRGEPVLTLSQQYILTGLESELDAARRGEILFYRQADLPPGPYTVEAVIFDALAERASARLSTVVVPKAVGGKLTASSLVVVRRTEQVPEGERAPNLPFYYGDRLLYPNTGEPFRQGVDKELMFYISLHPSPGMPSPAASLDLLKNGRVVATTPVPLAVPSVTGRLQHAGTLPIADLPSGTYELRLRLGSQNDEQIRATFFTIAPATSS